MRKDAKLVITAAVIRTVLLVLRFSFFFLRHVCHQLLSGKVRSASTGYPSLLSRPQEHHHCLVSTPASGISLETKVTTVHECLPSRLLLRQKPEKIETWSVGPYQPSISNPLFRFIDIFAGDDLLFHSVMCCVPRNSLSSLDRLEAVPTENNAASVGEASTEGFITNGNTIAA